MATMEQTGTGAGLYAKMARVMASMSRIPKRGRNTHFNYDFVTDGDVLDAVRAALVAEGIAFFVSFNEATHREKGITTGKFTLTFADAETGQTHDVQWVGEGQDTQDKGAAKAATSAVKYALLKTFLISTGDAADDPDSGNGAPRPQQRNTRTPQGPPPVDAPRDAWEEEESQEPSGAPAGAYLDVSEVGVFDTKAGGQPHIGLMGDGRKWPDARWWNGRTALLEAAPWLADSCTKERLGVIGARFPFAARVYYTEAANGYKTAERFERID